MADGEEATSGSEEFRREVRDRVRHCIMSIMRELELRISENGNLENLQQRLEWLLSVVIRYHRSNFIEQGIVDLLSEALACLSYSWEEANSATAERIFSGSPGRPKLNISFEQLNLKDVLQPFKYRNYSALVCVQLSVDYKTLVYQSERPTQTLRTSN